MLHIYYGMGKGKTSTLNGAALRAHGAGLSTAIFRFLKGRKTHEDVVLAAAGIAVSKFHAGTKFVLEMNPEEREAAYQVMKEGLVKAREASFHYQLIALDEVLDLAAPSVKFLTPDELLDFIKSLNQQCEILLSGHVRYESLFALADLITHYEAEKHYYEKGIKARPGIEY